MMQGQPIVLYFLLLHIQQKLIVKQGNTKMILNMLNNDIITLALFNKRNNHSVNKNNVPL